MLLKPIANKINDKINKHFLFNAILLIFLLNNEWAKIRILP